MAELFSISLYTLLVTYTGVGNLRLWAERRLLVVPNERSSHIYPTPSGVGVAIVLASLFGLIVFALLSHCLVSSLWFLITGGALIALVSWLDDPYTI
jgi:Fuc2NAc and GlcNAc transferase